VDWVGSRSFLEPSPRIFFLFDKT